MDPEPGDPRRIRAELEGREDAEGPPARRLMGHDGGLDVAIAVERFAPGRAAELEHDRGPGQRVDRGAERLPSPARVREGQGDPVPPREGAEHADGPPPRVEAGDVELVERIGLDLGPALRCAPGVPTRWPRQTQEQSIEMRLDRGGLVEAQLPADPDDRGLAFEGVDPVGATGGDLEPGAREAGGARALDPGRAGRNRTTREEQADQGLRLPGIGGEGPARGRAPVDPARRRPGEPGAAEIGRESVEQRPERRRPEGVGEEEDEVVRARHDALPGRKDLLREEVGVPLARLADDRDRRPVAGGPGEHRHGRLALPDPAIEQESLEARPEQLGPRPSGRQPSPHVLARPAGGGRRQHEGPGHRLAVA